MSEKVGRKCGSIFFGWVSFPPSFTLFELGQKRKNKLQSKGSQPGAEHSGVPDPSDGAAGGRRPFPAEVRLRALQESVRKRERVFHASQQSQQPSSSLGTPFPIAGYFEATG